MISKKYINDFLSNRDHKKVLSNIFSLSTLNGINYIFPLILLPYLVRILGIEKYGKYVFSFAILQYMMVLVNFGFNFSATKQAAIYRRNRLRISRIYSSVLFIRISASFFCVLLILSFILLFKKIGDESLLYIFGTGIFFGESLFPRWLFQGMEEMKYITIINSVSRIIVLLLIFIFVRNSGDYIYVNLFHSVGALVSGIAGFVVAIKKFNLRIVFPGNKDIFFQLKDGWFVFLSTIGMDMYRQANTIILGLMWNYKVVAFYVSAEKIIKVVQSLTSPVLQALYPFFSRKLNSDEDMRERSVINLNRIGKILFFLLFFVSIILILSAKSIISLYLGAEFLKAASNIRIMSFVILFGGLNYLYGIIGLVNLGYQKYFTISVFIAGILSVSSCVILGCFFADGGASATMVIAEAVLTLTIWLFYKKLVMSKEKISMRERDEK